MATLLLLGGCATPAAAPRLDRTAATDAKRDDVSQAWPLVIGHRGASGHRPEHTLEGYALAIELGADFIEPDLVATRDGVLVARHENEISGTTDVASHPEFADRRATKTIDGVIVTGFFTEDFTFDELRTLRARERLPDVRPGNTAYDGMFVIPSFEEILALVERSTRESDHVVGIYPETKHPTYFDSIGLSLEERLVETLEAHGYCDESSPVFVQSFETANLRELDGMTDVRLVQLLLDSGAPYDTVAAGHPTQYADMVTAAGLTVIAEYADGVGPAKGYIIPRDATGRLLEPTTFVADAHAVGLLVHPFTFRKEDSFLPSDLAGRPVEEMRRFLATGIDGFFTDFPDLGVEATRGSNTR